MSESFLPYHDGMYLLKAGTYIYRGDSDLPRSSTIPIKPVYYTIIDSSDPEQITYLENAYGIVHEYKVNRDVKLLAVDRISEKTYNDFPKHIRTILDNQFGYKTGKRDSVASKDKELVDYLCENDYDGYAANDMVAIDEPILYREIVLCNPKTCVEYIDQLTKPNVAHRLVEKHEAIMKAKEMKEGRRNKKSKGSPIVSKSLFGSPSDSPKGSPKNLFDSPIVSKSLFGSPKKTRKGSQSLSINRKLFGGKRKTRKQKQSK